MDVVFSVAVSAFMICRGLCACTEMLYDLVCVFVGFWDRDYVSQLPCVRYYIFVKSILMRNLSPRGPMCFRCLIFSLSRPCELIFLYCCLCCMCVYCENVRVRG